MPAKKLTNETLLEHLREHFTTSRDVALAEAHAADDDPGLSLESKVARAIKYNARADAFEEVLRFLTTTEAFIKE